MKGAISRRGYSPNTTNTMSKLTAAEQQSLAEQKRVNEQYERLAKEGINEARTQTEALREIITILRANAIAAESEPESEPEAAIDGAVDTVRTKTGRTQRSTSRGASPS